jgi:putative ABC transport system permease protein
MSGRASLVLRLALKDLLHEKRLVFCSLAGLAAVLAPLLVLFGLKNGAVEQARTDLIESPRARQITNQTTQSFDQDFLRRLQARPEVEFVTLRARTLNSEAFFARSDRLMTARAAELVPSGPRDPLLQGQPAPGPEEIVPQANFAARLGLQPGMSVQMRIPAATDREPLVLTLRVIGISPVSATGREAVLVNPLLQRRVSAHIDQQLPATATIADAEGLPFTAAEGFRLHVRSLNDVLALDAALRAEDVPVESRADEVGALFAMDRALTVLFALLAGLGGLGYLVSLGVSLYANVERKIRELSLLRLAGFRRVDLVAFTLVQAGLTGAAGAALASVMALGIQFALNRLWPLAGTGGAPAALSVIEAPHVAAAILGTIAGAALAAAFAGVRAGRVHPAEGVRYG